MTQRHSNKVLTPPFTFFSLSFPLSYNNKNIWKLFLSHCWLPLQRKKYLATLSQVTAAMSSASQNPQCRYVVGLFAVYPFEGSIRPYYLLEFFSLLNFGSCTEKTETFLFRLFHCYFNLIFTTFHRSCFSLGLGSLKSVLVHFVVVGYSRK